MDKPFAITLAAGSSRADHTGSWRTQRPVYVSNLPPCSAGCPAGEDVRAWLAETQEDGEGYRRGWEQIMAINPFPAVMGRICYHPCESSCNRADLDETVGINSVERFLGDEALRQGWTLPPAPTSSGKRVLVVGAGPAGLSAAYQLARLGHAVVVVESASEPGGMLRYGIPAYRLPRGVLTAEIGRILGLGVELRLDSPVTDLSRTLAEEAYDAVFLAVGAQIGRRAYLPAGSAAHVIDAVSMLHGLAEGDRPLLGRRVAVYGGGNTAIDAARTARRLGAEESLVVYRRTRDRMPAHPSEVLEAEAEGVVFRWLSTIDRVDGGTMEVERMELDHTGFPQPTGRIETLAADSVVLALGQDTDLSFLEGVQGPDMPTVTDGVVRVDAEGWTGCAAIYAGGDAAAGDRSATAAIGQGRRAAAAIHARLTGLEVITPTPPKPAEFAALNTWYYADAPRTHRLRIEPVRRQSTFDEVVQGFDASTALFEARRCMSCGDCFSCDNCLAVCPDNAVTKLEPPGSGYAIDLDFCKGCGLCVAECPAGAIEMVPEDI